MCSCIFNMTQRFLAQQSFPSAAYIASECYWWPRELVFKQTRCSVWAFQWVCGNSGDKKHTGKHRAGRLSCSCLHYIHFTWRMWGWGLGWGWVGLSAGHRVLTMFRQLLFLKRQSCTPHPVPATSPSADRFELDFYLQQSDFYVGLFFLPLPDCICAILPGLVVWFYGSLLPRDLWKNKKVNL